MPSEKQSQPVRERPAGSVLRIREFRWLLVASLQSLVGDQVARVAISILVFRRSHSALLTAAVYALTYLPAIAGGLLLGGLGDRWPRRTVLICCDLGRMVLLSLMSIRGTPIIVVAVLLALSVTVGAIFKSAEPALVADIFDADSLPSAVAVRSSVSQFGFLLGFAVGGTVVGFVGPAGGLLVDAGSFALSAGVLWFGLEDRPPLSGRRRPPRRSSVLSGLGEAFGTPARREVLALSWLAGLWVVPEGLAAPYVAAHGGGAVDVGLLLAATPGGCVVGLVLLMRRVSAQARPTWARRMAFFTGLPLLACAANPALWIVAVLWIMVGIGSAYQAQMMTEYVGLVVPDRRSHTLGIAGAGLIAVQGVGVLLGGALADYTSPALTMAIAGAGGSAAAAVIVGIYGIRVRT